MEIVWSILIIVGAYLIGSFPTGYLLVKAIKGEDIRKVGSGSTGATNVKRVLGKKGFFTVMLLDTLKGFFPVVITQYLQVKYNLYADLDILPIFVSLALILGHSKSIFLGFTGGKSVATTGGTIFGLNWMVGSIALVIWASVSYFSRYISLGSMMAGISLSILMFLFGQKPSYIIYCAIAAIYVIYLHRENIKRLLSGTENKVR